MKQAFRLLPCVLALCLLLGACAQGTPQSAQELPDETELADAQSAAVQESETQAAEEAAAEPEEARFRPEEAALVCEMQQALTRALGLEQTDLPDGMEAADVLTRADAAVLVNHMLGRTPDTAALEALSFDVLLDVPRQDRAFADIAEAVFPHAYLEEAESGREQWDMQALALRPMRAGAHTKKGIGYVVDDDGCVIRQEGIFSFAGWKYLSNADTGCIFADGALHPAQGHVVYARRGGQLLVNESRGEYAFDEDGFYTTGSERVDTLLDEAIAACTQEDMTQEEKLRACYDCVRSYKYLGRNAAFDESVKTPPYEKLLEFAEKILSTGKGDCYNFAASFCLLARRLGYEASCIIGECGYVWNWRPIAHGWVEITQDGQTLLYDPQIENYNIRAGISNDDYGAYGVQYETAHARYLKH